MDFAKVVHSAVLILHEQKTDSLILTKRSAHLRDHPGEICFPGGLWEVGDRDYYATALREVREELGINADRIQLIKELTQEQTLFGVVIHPWLARIDTLEPLVINHEEVASVLSVPFALAQQAERYRPISFTRGGKSYLTYEFIHQSERIWGATARIMMNVAY